VAACASSIGCVVSVPAWLFIEREWWRGGSHATRHQLIKAACGLNASHLHAHQPALPRARLLDGHTAPWMTMQAPNSCAHCMQHGAVHAAPHIVWAAVLCAWSHVCTACLDLVLRRAALQLHGAACVLGGAAWVQERYWCAAPSISKCTDHVELPMPAAHTAARLLALLADGAACWTRSRHDEVCGDDVLALIC
jgi:hypothetical protein